MSKARSQPDLAERVIRDKETGLYFIELPGGAWIESPAAATKYRRVCDMLAVCHRFELEEVELVLELKSGRPGVTMDVGPE
ncbi:MAG: hypothetical protein JWR69_3774 [Pedosphaera sp.]|nr:hypothetical protein [Pedosphaera sp.]